MKLILIFIGISIICQKTHGFPLPSHLNFDFYNRIFNNRKISVQEPSFQVMFPILKNERNSVQEPTYITFPNQSKDKLRRSTIQMDLQKILKIIFRDMKLKNVSPTDFINQKAIKHYIPTMTANEFFRIFCE